MCGHGAVFCTIRNSEGITVVNTTDIGDTWSSHDLKSVDSAATLHPSAIHLPAAHYHHLK
jgi:hypothetical protein